MSPVRVLVVVSLAAVMAVAAHPWQDVAPTSVRRVIGGAVFADPSDDFALDEREPSFLAECRRSHTAPDDPIVHPGHAGASHLHDFFGNRTTDAASTVGSLRQGGSTCHLPGDTAAYWTPALSDDGRVVPPSLAQAYYTLGGKDPDDLWAYPLGLRMIGSHAGWKCVGGGAEGRPSPELPSCGAGSHLLLSVRFPDCWDGLRLDAPDHHGHMRYATRGRCPASHPVSVPILRLNVVYPGADGGAVTLATTGDHATPPHADFINAWDPSELERLLTVCLRAGLHCDKRPPAARG